LTRLRKDLIPIISLEKDKEELFFDCKRSKLALETSIPIK
jgi:hypothetical protein